jgi:phage terminase Nu1 subunit (DNA packaging protein)
MARGKNIYVNAATLAEKLDISERRVWQLAAQGLLPKQGENSFDLQECVLAYDLYKNPPKEVEFEAFNLDRERARKTRAEAILAEIKVAHEQKLIVYMADVQEGVDQAMSALKDKFLAIPVKLSPHLAVETDKNIIKTMLDDAIRSGINELYEWAGSL